MRIGKARPIRRPIPLTPLIDVVFLLLLFFMLTSSFSKMSSLQVDAKRGSSDSSTGFPGALVDVAGANQVAVNGKRMVLDELPSALNELHALGVLRGVLVPGNNASVQDLVSAMEAVRRSRIESFAVVRK